MKIDEYKKISDNVRVPDVVWEGYQNAIKQIKMEKETDKNIVKISKWKNVNALAKIAVVFGAVVLLSGGTFLSVKAYISHLEKIRNMEAEEVIDLYENIFQYDSKYMSRSMSADEERRFSELCDLYCRDMAEPEGEVAVISSKDEYNGEGIAFSKEEGILNLPMQEMTDEEILQLVVFNLLGRYVDYEAYVKASNPLYYLNALEQMTMQEVDELYINYSSANTETSFYNRELSFDELGRRKVLKMLYKSGERQPENTMPIIQKESEYSGEDIAFCVNNCTFYFPNDELSDEQLLELIDFQIKDVFLDIGLKMTTICFKNQINAENTYLHSDERYLYQKLLENLNNIQHMNKEHAAKMMLRISRGSIYDWCCHNGSYDLIEAVHEEISIVLDYIGL